MAYNVRITRQFDRELDAACTRIGEELGMPRAADKFLDSYLSKLDLIAAFPYAFPVDAETSDRLGVEIRKLGLASYKIEYRIDEASKTIYLLTLMPTAMQDAPISLDEIG